MLIKAKLAHHVCDILDTLKDSAEGMLVMLKDAAGKGSGCGVEGVFRIGMQVGNLIILVWLQVVKRKCRSVSYI